jgi:hypothetical protein
MDESELREIRRAARRRQMTVSEWVRSALRAARRAEPGGEPGRRIADIRAASRHAFPTADIDQMQAEIEQGRAERGR